jgi:hypothetical protein
MNAKHTPGPWAAHDIDDDTSARQFWISDAADGGLIAAAEPIAEAVANARLIAAAPELYEALRACNARLLARMHTDSGDDYEAYSRSCAALAKVDA